MTSSNPSTTNKAYPTPNLIAAFSSITALHLAGGQISLLPRFQPLEELVYRRADEARHIKQNIRCQYSALHIGYFLHSPVKHTARTITKTVDFLSAS